MSELIKYATVDKDFNEFVVVMIEDYSETFEESDVNFEFVYTLTILKGDTVPIERRNTIVSTLISGGPENNKYSDADVDKVIENIKTRNKNGDVYIFEDEDITIEQLYIKYKKNKSPR